MRDLLSHRSGLPGHAGDLLEDYGYKDILYRLRYIPLNPFRASYAYTNFGFSEAAFAVAKSLDANWADLADRTLYQAPGMAHTSSRFEDYLREPQKSVTYQVKDGKAVALQIPRNPQEQAPAGGVSSTVYDLSKWMIFELAAAPGTLIETKEPNLNNYGMGWSVFRDEKGRLFYVHSGGFNLGVRTQVSLYPEEMIGIVVLTNASPSGLPEAITKD